MDIQDIVADSSLIIICMVVGSVVVPALLVTVGIMITVISRLTTIINSLLVQVGELSRGLLVHDTIKGSGIQAAGVLGQTIDRMTPVKGNKLKSSTLKYRSKKASGLDPKTTKAISELVEKDKKGGVKVTRGHR